MGRIQDQELLQRCVPAIKKAARTVAYQKRCPWSLIALRKAGLRAAGALRDEYRAKKEGLGDVSFEAYVQAQGSLEREMRATAEGLQAPPSEEAIEAALEEFTAEEWARLIAQFRRGDLEVLRAYVLENLDELETNLDLYKLKTIRGAVALRGVQLAFSDSPRFVRITDPMYIQQWQEEARYRKLTGAPPPSNTNRSWAEMGQPPAIAEGLGTSAYKVRKMLKRMEQTPFEKFDGDILEYWAWVAKTGK